MPWFSFALLGVAILSGATASVVGFGIGSLLTPLLTARYGADVAVAAITLPHAIATAVRCWRLRASINPSVLMRFGTMVGERVLLGLSADRFGQIVGIAIGLLGLWMLSLAA